MISKIKLTALIAVMFSILSTQATETNTYTNPTLGITITKPAEWRFITAEQVSENLARTRLKDEEMQKAVQKYANAPVVAMMKYAEPFDDVNPSLKVNIRPIGVLADKDPKDIAKLSVGAMGKMFQDFSIVTPPEDVTVSGLKGAHVKVHYTMQVADGPSFPTCSDLWIVPRGKFLFIIGSGTRQDEKTGKRDEIKKILDSLKLQKE
jgi:hypothetical protein